MSQRGNRWRAELAGQSFSSSFLSTPFFQANPSFCSTTSPTFIHHLCRLRSNPASPPPPSPRPRLRQIDHLKSPRARPCARGEPAGDDVTAETQRRFGDLPTLSRSKLALLFNLHFLSLQRRPALPPRCLASVNSDWPSDFNCLRLASGLVSDASCRSFFFFSRSSAVASHCRRPLHENKQKSERALKRDQRPSQRVTSFPPWLPAPTYQI